MGLIVLLPSQTVFAPTAQASQTPQPVVEEVQVVIAEEPLWKAPEPLSLTLWNCWEYTRQVYPSLPSTREIWNNLTDTPGGVAVFRYPSGLEHYAVVESIGTSTIHIKETNYRHGTVTERDISLTDPALKGFFLPQDVAH